jgi:hypothetical protein
MGMNPATLFTLMAIIIVGVITLYNINSKIKEREDTDELLESRVGYLERIAHDSLYYSIDRKKNASERLAKIISNFIKKAEERYPDEEFDDIMASRAYYYRKLSERFLDKRNKGYDDIFDGLEDLLKKLRERYPDEEFDDLD